MRTAEEIINKELGGNFIGEKTMQCMIDAVNEARKETIEEVHSIIAIMYWDVKSNTIDARELQRKVSYLINELK